MTSDAASTPAVEPLPTELELSTNEENMETDRKQPEQMGSLTSYDINRIQQLAIVFIILY